MDICMLCVCVCIYIYIYININLAPVLQFALLCFLPLQPHHTCGSFINILPTPRLSICFFYVRLCGKRDRMKPQIISNDFLLVMCCRRQVASVVSDSVQPHRWQPTRLPRPWDSPGKNTGVGCHFLLQCMKVKSESEVAQSCLTLSDPMDCSLPGSSVHGIFQARVLEWGAIAFSVLEM